MRFSSSLVLILVLFFQPNHGAAQHISRNIIIVTLDGYRWKEVFEGPDARILERGKYSGERFPNSRFSGSTVAERRSRLMPFFWNVIGRQGQLYGNRNYGNRVNCVNNHLLSYPGYSEMFVGFHERSVSSNEKKHNPNATVLEFINSQKGFAGRVAAFGTWEVFPYIFREERAKIYVNAGRDPAEGVLSVREKLANESLARTGRNDFHTFTFAFEYLKREKPRVMFIGFDGPDSHAHGARYGEYLLSAHGIDSMLNVLWSWVQSQPEYRDRTTLLVTTDHGRGNGVRSWKDHRLIARGSRHIWFAVMGPDTPAFGELRFRSKYFQKQVAKTIAAFVGLEYEAKEAPGDVVQTMIAVPQR